MCICWLPAKNVVEVYCLTAFVLHLIGREDNSLALIGQSVLHVFY